MVDKYRTIFLSGVRDGQGFRSSQNVSRRPVEFSGDGGRVGSVDDLTCLETTEIIE